MSENTLSIEEKFAQEVKQSDVDHHKPTAGAMTGHILANFKLQEMKLTQAKFYVKGLNAASLKEVFETLANNETLWFEKIAHELVIENEVIPTTLEEVTRYGKIAEHGQNKYLDATSMLENFAKDFDFQNIFITRAIKLAENEEKFGLQQLLIQLLSFNKDAIYQVQSLLGKTVREDLDEEDDDDDD
ncbi:ferritin-like domain-containing protein [Enterococcus timonensis]|uniref:ferritin-like domain-containing protein n=1 Tax=Enterococcus timonensis TaxID=1852364 RepID=UPI0008DA34BA|nr:ferritin-like domain-containing protein [Enterococcus timonensis]